MEFSNLSNFVLADVLSYFDSCYLGVMSLFLRKDISVSEAFVLTEIYVSDMRSLIKNKDKTIMINNTINYNSANKRVDISINILTNTVVVNSNLSTEDINNLNYIIKFKMRKSA